MGIRQRRTKALAGSDSRANRVSPGAKGKKGETMTLISIKNNSAGNSIIPARGGLGLVLAAGEEGTVCPEGLRAQGAFFDMVSRGHIEEKARMGRASRVINFTHSTDDHNQAA
ncbi:MAG: hypothetical protein HOJ22_09350 [Chloroflexi bacterium]|nr:hypothetical protein [Chloroflexota bacterium]MBT5628486.1 hypothetical protein [Chloroflexota bacterium]